MEIIQLQQLLPNVFTGQSRPLSGVWQQEITFTKGNRYLIEAASGTGKSSLCSYLYGYRNDYQGCIRFDDRDVRPFPIKRWTQIRTRSLSLLFQELRLFPELSAMENIRLKNDLTRFKAEKEIVALFERLGIADKVHAPVGKLSFGQQQRVTFIRSLCQPFDFILLDEPVSHLDETNASIMGSILNEEADKQGAGVLVTSIGKQLGLNYQTILQL
jgi:ABC-type lipoprotein export system ATPase subunit